MVLYAGGQQTAANPNALQLGVPTQVLLDGYTFGAQNSTDVVIGAACFFSATDDSVQAPSGSFGPFAGIVLRDNANAMPFGNSILGFSTTIAAGTQISVITRGSVGVIISAALSTLGTPVRGDIIYVVTATGLFNSVGAGGTPAGGSVVTNFRVGKVLLGWTNAAVVGITNTQNVGA
jgi:hypothetical protein